MHLYQYLDFIKEGSRIRWRVFKRFRVRVQFVKSNKEKKIEKPLHKVARNIKKNKHAQHKQADLNKP